MCYAHEASTKIHNYIINQLLDGDSPHPTQVEIIQ